MIVVLRLEITHRRIRRKRRVRMIPPNNHIPLPKSRVTCHVSINANQNQFAVCNLRTSKTRPKRQFDLSGQFRTAFLYLYYCMEILQAHLMCLLLYLVRRLIGQWFRLRPSGRESPWESGGKSGEKAGKRREKREKRGKKREKRGKKRGKSNKKQKKSAQSAYVKWTNHIKVPIVESRFARDMVVEETCQSVRMGWDWTGQAKKGLKGRENMGKGWKIIKILKRY